MFQQAEFLTGFCLFFPHLQKQKENDIFAERK